MAPALLRWNTLDHLLRFQIRLIRLHRRSLAAQLELRPRRKILNVVADVPRARQRLAVIQALAAGGRERDDCKAQAKAGKVDKLLAGDWVPEPDHTKNVSKNHRFAVVGECDHHHGIRLLMESEQGITPTPLPQVSPFPSAKVCLSGRGPVAFQHFAGASKVVRSQRLLHDTHVGCIGKPPCSQLFRLRPKTLLLFISARLISLLSAKVRFSACPLLSEQRPRRNSQAHDQRQHHHHAIHGGFDKGPPYQFLQPINRAGRTGHHRFVVEKPTQIHRQAVGRLVAPGSILLQTLHDHPVEVPAQL